MSLSRWMYDDSAVHCRYGLGFLWFLVRPALALCLGVVDPLLTAGCSVAGVVYLVHGPTGRDIAFGVQVPAAPIALRLPAR